MYFMHNISDGFCHTFLIYPKPKNISRKKKKKVENIKRFNLFKYFQIEIKRFIIKC